MRLRQGIAFVVLCAIGIGLLLAVALVPWDDNAPARARAVGYTPGTPVPAHVGEDFVVWVKANPSTGYSWTAAPNRYLTFVSTRQVSRTERSGAPDTQQLTFRPVRVGTTVLKLTYVRPWEHGVAPADTINTTVHITK